MSQYKRKNKEFNTKLAALADARKAQRRSLRIGQHTARLIEQEVAFFNGWAVSEKNMKQACQKAANKVLRYLIRKVNA